MYQTTRRRGYPGDREERDSAKCDYGRGRARDVQRADLQEKECAVTLEKCIKEVAKAKKLLLEFRTKFGRFFGPGKGDE
jgi:hypothetical protein